MYKTLVNNWDKLPSSTGAGFQPSIVWLPNVQKDTHQTIRQMDKKKDGPWTIYLPANMTIVGIHPIESMYVLFLWNFTIQANQTYRSIYHTWIPWVCFLYVFGCAFSFSTLQECADCGAPAPEWRAKQLFVFRRITWCFLSLRKPTSFRGEHERYSLKV